MEKVLDDNRTWFGIIGLLPCLGILMLFFKTSLNRTIKNPDNLWVLAFQITLLVTAIGQPAMAFAYIKIVWASLTGLWIGSQLRFRVV